MNTKLVDLVKACYGDCNGLTTRLLDFKTERIRDFETFKEALLTIGKYNAFNPKAVADAVEPVWKELSGVQIAREGSPALYFGIPYWTNQQIGWMNGNEEECACKLSAGRRMEIELKVREALADQEVDELEMDQSDYELRAWWD